MSDDLEMTALQMATTEELIAELAVRSDAIALAFVPKSEPAGAVRWRTAGPLVAVHGLAKSLYVVVGDAMKKQLRG